MMVFRGALVTSMVGVMFLGAVTAADVMPFTETFDAGASNWRELGGGSDATWSSDGYITTSAAFADAGPFGLTLFRGHDAFDSSGDAFVGDWIGAGITHFSFDIRHDAPVPVNFFSRFATSPNFPAFAGVDFGVAMPNTWTTVTIDVREGSAQLFGEGDFEHGDVFSQIGNVQVGFSVPDGWETDTTVFNYDIDNIRMYSVPSPGVLALLSLGVVGARRRR